MKKVQAIAAFGWTCMVLVYCAAWFTIGLVTGNDE